MCVGGWGGWGEVTAQVWDPNGSQLCGLGRGVALFPSFLICKQGGETMNVHGALTICQARFKCFPHADSVLTPSLWPGYPPPPTAQRWTLRHKDTGGPAPGRCAAGRPAPHTLASEPRFTITTRRWSPRPRRTARGGEASRAEHGLCIRNAHRVAAVIAVIVCLTIFPSTQDCQPA